MNTNTYTPSKELLSAVLKTNIQNDDVFIQENEIRFAYFRQDHEWVNDKTNLYELAIKTKQKYPDIDLNLAATDISEFWRQANILAGEANNE